MSTATTTATDLVNVEIDGEAVAVPKGSMIIQASDKVGKPIPRFCYHDKLPVAANCRMCLVEVEKSGKPLPACATPVMEGMKVFTRSEKALRSQRNVMEFLLINHPLDCPICDQGGECELQDVAMGYGRSVSRFVERKRAVADEDLGSLIATDMTRCIHCTRCVRFMREIAGTTELGGMGRGENLEIGTWIGKSIESELGGNIIDVCPVGALTNKVFRYKARAWEMIARASLGYHDALHSNLFLHTRRGEVLRTVPRENESINENWLSDRDRYSHQGLYADDRAQQPMVRDGDAWRETSWDEALQRAAELLREAPLGQTGFLVGPATSCEEGGLLTRLATHVASTHIDHRLGHVDFADDGSAAAHGGFEMPLAQVEHADVIVLIGCDPRREAPILGHRIRKASKAGARIYALNSVDFPFHFPLAGVSIAAPTSLQDHLAAFAAAVFHATGTRAPAHLSALMAGATPDAGDEQAAQVLKSAQRAVIIVGQQAQRGAHASAFRSLGHALARAAGAAYNLLPDGANSVGLSQVGVLPGANGRHAAGQVANALPAYVLYNAESLDFAEPARAQASLSAGKTLAFSAYANDALKQVADVILPIGLLPEIDATLVNVDGQRQVVAAGSKLPGQARPGWRVLRALGELLGASGFDAVDVDAVRGTLALAPPKASAKPELHRGADAGDGLERIAILPIYRIDAVVRRAPALQVTPLSLPPAALLHPDQAARLGLNDAARVRVRDPAGATIELPVRIDATIPVGAVGIEAGHEQTSVLAASGRLHVEEIAS